MSHKRVTEERIKVRRRTPKHGGKLVHADKRLRDKQGYRKHKGEW